jgi:predicted nucleotidyltransferase
MPGRRWTGAYWVSLGEVRPELAAAYLHGSAATGRATPLSDIDFAVVPAVDFPAEHRGATLRELVTALERAHPGEAVDVRFLMCCR